MVRVLLVLALLWRCAMAIELFVDADVGALVMSRPDNVGLWPDADGYCRESLDGQYIAHSDRYQVDDFVYQENDFGAYGGIAHSVYLYDAQEAVHYMHAIGVWAVPHSCSAINHQFMTQVLQPLASEKMSEQVKRVGRSDASKTVKGVLSSRMHGIVMDMLCKDPRNMRLPHEIRDEYHVCEAGETIRIAQARQSQMHAIRAERERQFKSGE